MEKAPSLKPRAWYSILVNLDEAYSFLGAAGNDQRRGPRDQPGHILFRACVFTQHSHGQVGATVGLGHLL